jgi:uncharacterized Zn finger protein
MGAFDKVIPGQQIVIRCSKCGQQKTQSLQWVRSNKLMTCAGCGTKVETAQFDTSSRSSQGGVNDRSKNLSNSTRLRTKGE